jgi:hypothetical protein
MAFGAWLATAWAPVPLAAFAAAYFQTTLVAATTWPLWSLIRPARANRRRGVASPGFGRRERIHVAGGCVSGQRDRRRSPWRNCFFGSPGWRSAVCVYAPGGGTQSGSSRFRRRSPTSSGFSVFAPAGSSPAARERGDLRFLASGRASAGARAPGFSVNAQPGGLHELLHIRRRDWLVVLAGGVPARSALVSAGRLVPDRSDPPVSRTGDR